MLFVSVTRLRIRSVRFLPLFALSTSGALRQVRNARGFQQGSLALDRSWTFWTMTAWDSQQSMRAYMTTGTHKKAMPRLLDWCDEASVVHWEQAAAALPSWTEADQRMRSEGRSSKVHNPSPQNATLKYRTPRIVVDGPILPAGK